MDAVIRFCFTWVEPDKITDVDLYAKLYSQAKYVWDQITLTPVAKAMKEMQM